jgi:hypothetical protein
MQVKFAYTVSGAAAVALMTASGTSDDSEAGLSSDGTATTLPDTLKAGMNDARGSGARAAGCANDNENGVRLAVAEIITQGRATGAGRLPARLPLSRRGALPMMGARPVGSRTTKPAARARRGVQAAAVGSRGAEAAVRPRMAHLPAGRAGASSFMNHRVQPDAHASGGPNTTDGPPATQASGSASRAKILVGDGVWAGEVGVRAQAAACDRAAVQTTCSSVAADDGPGSGKRAGTRFHTPLQVDVPCAYEAKCAHIDARQHADPIDAPRAPAAMPTDVRRGGPGLIASGGAGCRREGAFALHDVRDSHPAVLDAVKRQAGRTAGRHRVYPMVSS